ncbi:NADPH-dependent codeinone reductase-like protein [Melia azedarach]|uniref:NADPH-dependent codeinone reductase-like protein n=1 Tax=Melia azedarach TaxID=155640 RepID=A0ACC1XJW3_MELAZ|nr:NADPH-dependent codeinone reductase-like protein [Melia azedarach]
MASSQHLSVFAVPEAKLSSSSGHPKMPVIGLGTAVDNNDEKAIAKPSDKYVYPIAKEDLLAMDFKGVWEGMEECQRLGLTKSIGVEMNPAWRQKKLVEFCKSKSIILTAFSPLGAAGSSWGNNQVMNNEALKQIAKARGKTVAQVCLRWIIEQGATVVVKSFNKERLKENLGIFDWELSDNDYEKINKIPQQRMMVKEELITSDGPFKTPEELWDD